MLPLHISAVEYVPSSDEVVSRRKHRDETGWIAMYVAGPLHVTKMICVMRYGWPSDGEELWKVEDASEANRGSGEQDENGPQHPRPLALRKGVICSKGVT